MMDLERDPYPGNIYLICGVCGRRYQEKQTGDYVRVCGACRPPEFGDDTEAGG